MRVLVIFAHPLAASFLGAAHRAVIEALESGGHTVDDLDLYAEKFDPVLSATQMRSYIDASRNARERCRARSDLFQRQAARDCRAARRQQVVLVHPPCQTRPHFDASLRRHHPKRHPRRAHPRVFNPKIAGPHPIREDLRARIAR